MRSIHFGILLFLVGALGELRNYVVGAWPTSLTWVLMGCGLLFVAAGGRGMQSRWRYLAYGAPIVLMLGIAVAWLFG